MSYDAPAWAELETRRDASRLSDALTYAERIANEEARVANALIAAARLDLSLPFTEAPRKRDANGERYQTTAEVLEDASEYDRSYIRRLLVIAATAAKFGNADAATLIEDMAATWASQNVEVE